LIRRMLIVIFVSYRPKLHYMRGPGRNGKRSTLACRDKRRNDRADSPPFRVIRPTPPRGPHQYGEHERLHRSRDGQVALGDLAQSLARELSPQSIHVTHFVIDGRAFAAPSGLSRQTNWTPCSIRMRLRPTIGMFVATAQRFGWGNGTAALDQNCLVGPSYSRQAWCSSRGRHDARAVLSCRWPCRLQVTLVISVPRMGQTILACRQCSCWHRAA
jgi:hypothetical protein